VTCSKSTDPPSYFECPAITNPPSSSPSDVPIDVPSLSPSLAPSKSPSNNPTYLDFEDNGSAPSMVPVSPSVVPSTSPQNDYARVVLNIYFDAYPQETSWLIKDATSGTIYKEVSLGTYTNIDHTKEDLLLPRGNDLVFVLMDSARDGIMGYGSEVELKLVADDGVGEVILLEVDGNFGGELETIFQVPETLTFPTTAPVPPTFSPAPTPISVTMFFTIWFDHWHEETSWKIVDSNDESIVYDEIPYGEYKYGSFVTEEIHLPPGRSYTLVVEDYFADGIASQGYRLWKAEDNVTIVSGDGDFQAERRHTFLLDYP
jgi:hypothetical protein